MLLNLRKFLFVNLYITFRGKKILIIKLPLPCTKSDENTEKAYESKSREKIKIKIRSGALKARGCQHRQTFLPNVMPLCSLDHIKITVDKSMMTGKKNDNQD